MHPVDLFNAREVIDSLIEERDAYSATSMEMERENWRLTAEVARLKSNLAALEDEKNTYIDYVGDALGQDHDRETLWDAAQRVLSDRDRRKSELAALREVVSEIADGDCYYSDECTPETMRLYCHGKCNICKLRDALGR